MRRSDYAVPDRPLWPTPVASNNRKSRKAMTASKDNGRRSGAGNSSPPGLEQAVELAMGVMPKELDGMALEDMAPGDAGVA